MLYLVLDLLSFFFFFPFFYNFFRYGCFGLIICLKFVYLINPFCYSCKSQNAGNEAVRSGRYAEAVEHYTTALSSNIESRPFAAICFCNRAAALQASGQIADAIADCSLAMALDGNYTKVCFENRSFVLKVYIWWLSSCMDLQGRLVKGIREKEMAKIIKGRK